MTNDRDRVQNAIDDIELAIALTPTDLVSARDYLFGAKKWLEESSWRRER